MYDIHLTDTKLKLVKGELPDWYTIEHAEHDNKTWMEKTSHNTSALRYSGRISDACVEGTSVEMQCIADAIEMRGRYDAKRCCVDASGERALFHSPRNSHVLASVPMESAVDLAEQIRKELT